MNGHGELVYEDGRKYKGYFVNDKKHGQGIYKWANGKSYNGMWINGSQHGQGVFTNADGKSRLSVWKNGEFVKWINEDGKTKSTISEDFKMTKSARTNTNELANKASELIRFAPYMASGNPMS